jgi:hypothetical protein
VASATNGIRRNTSSRAQRRTRCHTRTHTPPLPSPAVRRGSDAGHELVGVLDVVPGGIRAGAAAGTGRDVSHARGRQRGHRFQRNAKGQDGRGATNVVLEGMNALLGGQRWNEVEQITDSVQLLKLKFRELLLGGRGGSVARSQPVKLCVGWRWKNSGVQARRHLPRSFPTASKGERRPLANFDVLLKLTCDKMRPVTCQIGLVVLEATLPRDQASCS